MAKKKTIVERERGRRDKLTVAEPCPHLTPAEKNAVVRYLEEGATLAEVINTRGLCSHGSLYRARAADPEFDEAVRAALVQGAAAAIAEAEDLSRDAVESGDTDAMRIAESFHRCTLGYAEKVAPRDYGQLIKLGGHDGGALSVQVTNYALPVLEGKFRQLEDGRAREPAKPADDTPLDPT